jgi:predicted DNA-binding transcriptional regulator AlpA
MLTIEIPSEAAADVFLPARKVWERYGIADMTLHRWLRDDEMGFPAPTYLGRFRYWKLSHLIEWERARVGRKDADARTS